MSKFELITMQINNLQIPMIRVGKDTYVTQHCLSTMLGIDSITIRCTYRNRREEFDGLSVYSVNAKEFIKQHKHLLGVQRVREDMHLWSGHDMVVFSWLVRGERGRRIRHEIIEQVLNTAQQKVVSVEEHEQALHELSTIRVEKSQLQMELEAVHRELEELKGIIEPVKPFLREVAKAAGRNLRAQKDTKALRN